MSMIDRAGMHGRARRAAVSFLFLSAAACLLASPGTTAAQRATSKSAASSSNQSATSRPVDVRWYPWIGCWQRTTEAGAGAVLTCIVPGDGASAVDVLVVANGAVESREHLVVDGRPHPIERDGCTGSQTASWASTGARIYIGSAYTCAGNLHGRSSTLYAILPTGEWIDARQVEAGDGRVLNITRYRDAGVPSTVPSSIRSQIAQHGLAATTARASAGGSVSPTEVAEAQRAVDSVVVQAWLTARAQAYNAYGNAYASAQQPSAPPVTAVYVYEGTPPAQPAAQGFPSTRVPMCDSSGCYTENPYSEYNGMSYSQYPPYPSMWYGSSAFGNPYGFGYYPYGYPVVVFGTGVGNHFGNGRVPFRGGGVFHGPPGGRPMGPSGVQPGQPRGPGGIPGRGRP